MFVSRSAQAKKNFYFFDLINSYIVSIVKTDLVKKSLKITSS